MALPSPPRPAAGAACVAALLLLAAPPPAGAVQDTSLGWTTITTDHFRVSYHEGLDEIALRVANAGEEAHRRLTGLLGYAPKGRTEVVVMDVTDDANAMTMAVPYNQITIWPTSPPDMSALENYDDWMLALMVHEYTHVLHLDNWGGLVSALNAIFGKLFLMNAAQPLWVLEGYTVFEESSKTSGGRLGSSTWDMYMRAAVLENRFLPIDTVSGPVLEWPHGSAPYLYGSHFFSWMVGRYGEGFLWAYAEDYGDDWIPFGINRDIEKITGKTWVTLWNEWKGELAARYGAERAALEKEGLREGMRLTFSGETDRSPRFSPDGSRVAYASYDGHEKGGIHLLELGGARAAWEAWEAAQAAGVTGAKKKKGKGKAAGAWKEKKVVELTGEGSLAWDRAGQGLFYSRSEVFKGWYDFHDLYYVELADPENPARLTEGRRARQPDLAPDGERLVYTVNKGGSSSLFLAGDALAPLAGEAIDPLPPTAQAYAPRFSPDGTKVAYSAWLPGGKRDIRVVDLATGEAAALTDDRHVDSGPAWDPAGRYLYFASDRTGISNIYAWEPAAGRLWQVTNVLGGCFMPDVSPDGEWMVYVGYTAKGYDLFLLRLDPSRWVARDPALPAGDPKGHAADLAWAGKIKEPKKKSYNPLVTLLPRYWQARVEDDGFGQSMTVYTSAADIAGHHSIAASLHFGLEGRSRVGYSLSYACTKLPFDLRLDHSRYVAPQGGLRIDDQWKLWPEIGYHTQLQLSYPVFRGDFYHYLRAGYRLAYLMAEEGMKNPVDPNSALPVLPDRGYLSGVSLGYVFSNVQGSTYGVTAEKGGNLWVDLSFDLPQLGSDYTSVSVNYGATGYFKPIPKLHHVIAVRFAGGYGGSTFGRRGVFVLGGFPQEDILRDIVNRMRMWSVALRGYPPSAAWGDQYYLVNFEYRIPLLDIFRGVLTVPWQLSRIYMTLFTDVGAAWPARRADWKSVKAGVGAELFLSMNIVYYENLTFRIGYAYGIMEGGGHHYYVVLSTPF